MPRESMNPANTFRIALIVCSWLLAACSAKAPLLNSERIEARFGSYAVTLLTQQDRWRVSSLESVDNGVATTRTLAVVRFAEPVPAELATVHARIRAGASLGASLQEAGWRVVKTDIDTGQLALTAAERDIATLMRVADDASLALHIYRLDAVSPDRHLVYATIAELHHPDYLRVDDVQAIYGVAHSPAWRRKMLNALPELLKARADSLVR
jgi:hypothetical protein